MALKTQWLKGYSSDAERKKRIEEIESYKNAFEALIEILEDEYETPKKADYDSPSWSHKQADMNGANRKLRQIIELIRI